MAGGGDLAPGALFGRAIGFAAARCRRATLGRNEEIEQNQRLITGQGDVLQPDIVRLQVVMEKLQPLGQHQRVGQLPHQLQGIEGIDRRFALGQLLQSLGEGQSIDVGLGHVGAAVGRLANMVDGRNTGVTNLSHGAGAVNQTAGKAVVLREAGANNIESYQTVVINVVGLVQVRISLLGDALFYLILI